MSVLPNPVAAARSLAVLAALAIAAATAAWSQSPPQPAPKTVIIQVAPVPEPVVPLPAVPEPSVQPVPAPVVHENPGLINEIGKILAAPTWGLPALPALPSLKMPSDTNDALPKLQTMVKGRMVCPVSANGAPDCKAGSDRLCQSKGFKEGKSFDTDSAESCSRKSLLTGNRADDVCKTENYVTRALCQ